MASIRRREATWQVQVRRQGLRPLIRTFRLKADAELWARQREAEIDRGDLPPTIGHFARSRFQVCLAATGIRLRRKNAVLPKSTISCACSWPTPLLAIARKAFSKRHSNAYRDERLFMVAAGTVRRELAVLQHCFEIAAQ